MARYVKVEDLFKCETCKHGDNGLCNSFMWCEFHEEYSPDMRKLNVTEDVQVVRHGHWIKDPESGETRCSECDWSLETTWESNYCPDCGVMMYEEVTK